MPNIKAEVRGMHFHPPASTVIATLPMGCLLKLEPEPFNPYDSTAVRVLVDMDQLDKALIQDHDLGNAGIDPEEFWAQDQVWLGYVAKEQSAVFTRMIGEGKAPQGSLGFGLNAKGKTIYELTMEV